MHLVVERSARVMAALFVGGLYFYLAVWMVNSVVGVSLPDWFKPFFNAHPVIGVQLQNFALGILAYLPVAAILGLLLSFIVRRSFVAYGLIGVFGFLVTSELFHLAGYIQVVADESPPQEAKPWIDSLTYLSWIKTHWSHNLKYAMPLLLVMAASLVLSTVYWGRAIGNRLEQSGHRRHSD